MIEIKITIDTALNLLLNRMKLELKFRQHCGLIMDGLRLEELPYKQLYSIVETSIFDTVFLLPVDLITNETNLNYIITGTVKALARIFHYEEFSLFSNKQTKKLLEPIYEYLTKQLETKEYERN
jgi:hypothetical protein